MGRATVLFAVLLACSAAVPSPALADGRTLIDENYRFRLERPGPDWRLLGPQEITKIVPDAVAGAVSSEGLFGAVIVEAAPNASLEPLARMVLDSMALEHRQIQSFETVRFQDRDAVEYQVTGRVQGVQFVYRNVVFLHQAFAYQVLSWSVERRASQRGLGRFAGAFSLLSGEVKARAATREAKDVEGVGWRVKDGVFESAVYGIVVRPQGSWRLAVAGELLEMSADAEVGLIHAAPECYVTLIPEMAVGADREALVSAIRDASPFEGSEGAPTTTHRVRIGEQDVNLLRYERAGPLGIVFYLGAFFVGDVCVSVNAWHVAGLGKALETPLEEAFASIQFLDPEEHARLAEELRQRPDLQISVGHGHALRGGRYRSFEYGLVWEAPPGWWRMAAGQEAHRQNPDASLVVEAPELGLNVVLISEAGIGVSPERYHRTVVANHLGAGSPALEGPAETHDLGQAQGHLSSGTARIGALEFEFHLLTAVHQGRALQLVVSGMPGNVRRHREAVAAALGGLRVQRQLRPVSSTGPTLFDWRLGFSMTPPGTRWHHEDETPGALRSLGSMHVWSRPGRTVRVMAICSMHEGQDMAWFEDLMARILRTNLGKLGFEGARRQEAEIDGRPATRLELGASRRRIAVHLLSRGRTFYALLCELRAGDPPEIEDGIMRGFRLLN